VELLGRAFCDQARGEEESMKMIEEYFSGKVTDKQAKDLCKLEVGEVILLRTADLSGGEFAGRAKVIKSKNEFGETEFEGVGSLFHVSLS